MFLDTASITRYKNSRLSEFNLTVEGMPPYGIAVKFTADGVLSPGGKNKGNQGTVKSILTNEKYKGDALLQKEFTVDFLTKKQVLNHGEVPQYYVEGNHEAIIRPEVFELVQHEFEARKNRSKKHSSVHIFSGRIKCGHCGNWYGLKVWHSNDKYRRVIWQCNHKFDDGDKCPTPNLTDEEIERLFVSAVNQLISNKDAMIAAFNTAMRPTFDTFTLESEDVKLQAEMLDVSELVQNCIYENVHIAIDQAEYQKHYDGLTVRFETAKARLEAVTSAISNKQSRQATIEAFLKTLSAQDSLVEKFDATLWCELVDFMMVYSKDDVRFTFKNGTEIKA